MSWLTYCTSVLVVIVGMIILALETNVDITRHVFIHLSYLGKRNVAKNSCLSFVN